MSEASRCGSVAISKTAISKTSIIFNGDEDCAAMMMYSTVLFGVNEFLKSVALKATMRKKSDVHVIGGLPLLASIASAGGICTRAPRDPNNSSKLLASHLRLPLA